MPAIGQITWTWKLRVLSQHKPIPMYNQLKTTQLNIQSISNCQKQLNLELYFKENYIDIFSLNETFLKTDFKFELKNYFIYRKDRCTSSRGGVALLINKSLQRDQIVIPETFSQVEVIGA